MVLECLAFGLLVATLPYMKTFHFCPVTGRLTIDGAEACVEDVLLVAHGFDPVAALAYYHQKPEPLR